MGSFGLEKLSIENQSLHGKLRIISLVLFVFPFTVMFYILYQQGFFSSLDPLHEIIFLFITILAFAGIMVLRQAFNKFILVSIFMKKAEAGEMVMMDLPKDSSEFSQISTSFNTLISRLEETGKTLEKMDGELKKAHNERNKAENALTPLKKAVDIMQLGVTITDMQRKILYTNIADARMHGYDVSELVGMDVRIFAPVSCYKDLMPEDLKVMTNWSRESVNCRKDGSFFPVRITSDIVRDIVDGELSDIAIVTTCEDISERKRSEETLRLRQRVIESSSNGIMITDTTQPENPIIYVNPAFGRITGYEPHEALGRSMHFLLGEDQEQAEFTEIHASLHEQREGSAVLRNYRKDGSLFWNDLSVSPVLDEAGNVAHFVWVINDVTEREQHEELLEYQASHDALTGLPNRNLLADRINQLLANARRYNMRVAVLFIDLDNFKLVNDSLGHALGDQMLVIQAERLHKIIRSGDTVARYGGDEFVVVVSNLEKSEDAATVAHNIQELVSRPFAIDGHEFGITCSIGISLFPKDGNDVDSLLKNADAAMYRAKEQSRNSFQFYTSEMNDRVVERMVIERHLRHALELGQLEVHYQPQVEVNNGQLVGVEALLRWHSPELGTVPPDRFIPLAEETGLIVQIGEWVLKTCCEQNKAWQKAGLTPVTISVNISARQLQKKDLSAVIAEILRESGLEPRFLELEIVESMVMHDVESAAVIMKDLKKLGIMLAMDDFGTGYSSLSYLKRFPFDKLKIDLSFVRDIMTDPESAAIARAIIAMAHNLNLRAIAEGVETKEQLDYLRQHGCDEIQGYYVSRPVTALEFETLLRKDVWFQQPDTDALIHTRPDKPEAPHPA
ncbi:MAG: EAL domain-containing protein [Geobacteraceae bacterium]|nr:EAL domain-containing protein [Geobacteraceae bacterium]